MQTRSEMDRLRDVYRDYAERGFANSKWSLDNCGNQEMRRERSHHLDALLCGSGLLPLTSRRILDLGCGTGENLASFKDWGAGPENLFGVDLLAERIRIATKRFPMLTFQQANAEDLPFGDGFFDIVCVFTVFTSILDERMARNISREIERVLTSDGSIIWYDFRIRSPHNPNVRGMSRREIQSLFPRFRMALRTLTLVPPLARRLGPTTPWLYPCLAAFPFLRTHYLGVLTRLSRSRARSTSLAHS
jgi:SAM-dependent methyltransferase